MYSNVKIKIALSKDEVGILIKIFVGDHWAFVIRWGKIDNLNATCGWTEPIVFLLFKAMIPGSVSECQDIGCLQSIPEYPNAFASGRFHVGNFTSSNYEGPMVSYQNLD